MQHADKLSYLWSGTSHRAQLKPTERYHMGRAVKARRGTCTGGGMQGSKTSHIKMLLAARWVFDRAQLLA